MNDNKPQNSYGQPAMSPQYFYLYPPRLGFTPVLPQQPSPYYLHQPAQGNLYNNINYNINPLQTLTQYPFGTGGQVAHSHILPLPAHASQIGSQNIIQNDDDHEREQEVQGNESVSQEDNDVMRDERLAEKLFADTDEHSNDSQEVSHDALRDENDDVSGHGEGDEDEVSCGVSSTSTSTTTVAQRTSFGGKAPHPEFIANYAGIYTNAEKYNAALLSAFNQKNKNKVMSLLSLDYRFFWDINELHVVEENQSATLLTLAVKNEWLDVVIELLHRGAFINKRGYRSYTPLELSIKNENNSITAYLLRMEADPNLQGEHGETALHMAISRGDVTSVKMFVENGGAKLNLQYKISQYSLTPVEFASYVLNNSGDEKAQRQEIVSYFESLNQETLKVIEESYNLAKEKIKEERQNFDKKMLEAIEKNDPKEILRLQNVRRNFSWNPDTIYNKKTINICASQHKSFETDWFDVFKKAVRLGARINVRIRTAQPAIYWAVRNQDEVLVEYILKVISGPGRKLENAFIPFCLAADNKNEKIVQMLVEIGQVNIAEGGSFKKHRWNNMLEVAERYSSRAIVEYLKKQMLSSKDDQSPQAEDNDKAKKHKKSKHKKHKHKKNKQKDHYSNANDYNRAIFEAFDAEDNNEIIKLLKLPREFPWNINDVYHHKKNKQKDEVKDTILTRAVSEGRIEIVNEAIYLGADVNKFAGKSEKTPLILAAKGGHKEVVVALLEVGANANLRGKDGAAPIYYAIKKPDANLVKILVENGRAKIDLKPYKTQWILKPLDYATKLLSSKKYNHHEIEEIQKIITYLRSFSDERLNHVWKKYDDEQAKKQKECEEFDKKILRAMDNNKPKKVLKLLNKKRSFRWDVNKEHENKTLLFRASEHKTSEKGWFAVIKKLTHLGAEINKPNQSKITPLCHAIRNEDIPLITHFLNLTADPVEKLPNGYLALAEAIKIKNLAIVKMLVEQGNVDVTRKAMHSGKSCTMLQIAEKSSTRKIVDYIKQELNIANNKSSEKDTKSKSKKRKAVLKVSEGAEDESLPKRKKRRTNKNDNKNEEEGMLVDLTEEADKATTTTVTTVTHPDSHIDAEKTLAPSNFVEEEVNHDPHNAPLVDSRKKYFTRAYSAASSPLMFHSANPSPLVSIPLRQTQETAQNNEVVATVEALIGLSAGTGRI